MAVPRRARRSVLPRLLIAAGALLMILLALGMFLEEPASGEPGSGLGKVAYVVDGDVWTKALPGGEPRRITDDGRSFAPRWSPSGDWLTVLKTGVGVPETWVVRLDGSLARPLDAAAGMPSQRAAAWSPVEDRLAYVAQGGAEIVMEDAAGTEPRVLASAEPSAMQETWHGATWSQDGKSLAFVKQSRPAFEAVWAVDVTGEDARELYRREPSGGQLMTAGWSASAGEVYFWSSAIYSASIMADGLPLWSVPSAGGEARSLGITTLVYGDFLDAANGRLLAVDGGGRDALSNKRLAVLDARLSTVETLTSSLDAAIAPASSPDGQRVAFVASSNLRPAGDLITPMANRRVWLIDASGGNQRRLTAADTAEERPLWSRDGD